MTANDYDSAYKFLFSHPEMVAGLLQDFVHEDWVLSLDFGTLECYSSHYVSDGMQRRQNDMVWRVRSRELNGWCYVYLLFEFQSRVDSWMALRILVYVGLLYQDLIKKEQIKAGEPLPPVFPLVLYNGLGRWAAAREMSKLVLPLSSGLREYLPRQRYFLLDESRVSGEMLSESQSLAGLLLRMEKARSPEDLRSAIQVLIDRLREDRYASLRRAFTVWTRRVLLARMVPREPVPEVNDLEEMNHMLAERVTQWTEKWKRDGWREGHRKGRQEGRQEGRLEGRQEGRLEGRQEGQAAVLERLLRKRFGAAASAFQDRVRNASLEQLEIWAERVLDARTIEEVFA